MEPPKLPVCANCGSSQETPPDSQCPTCGHVEKRAGNSYGAVWLFVLIGLPSGCCGLCGMANSGDKGSAQHIPAWGELTNLAAICGGLGFVACLAYLIWDLYVRKSTD